MSFNFLKLFKGRYFIFYGVELKILLGNKNFFGSLISLLVDVVTRFLFNLKREKKKFFNLDFFSKRELEGIILQNLEYSKKIDFFSFMKKWKSKEVIHLFFRIDRQGG